MITKPAFRKDLHTSYDVMNEGKAGSQAAWKEKYGHKPKQTSIASISANKKRQFTNVKVLQKIICLNQYVDLSVYPQYR